LFDKIDTPMKNFKLILSSLISNHSCVEGGRRKPWYFAIPMFFLAVLLALIPTFVQTYTKEGDVLVKSNSYEMDVSSYYFVKEINDLGIEMKVKDGKLSVDKEKWDASFTTTDPSGNKCYIHYHPNPTTQELTPDLGVYYMLNSELDETVYKTITSFPSPTEEGATVARNYSFILFTDESVAFYIYASAKPNNNSVGTIYGDYKHLDNDWTVNSMFVEKDSKATWENWKYFYRKAYETNRFRNTWQTCLIITGINVGIVAFMGFMLWVLTRGKNNLHWFGIWETQKIAYWATITPAILTTGLGFLLTSFSQVLFPLLLGVRIMWLSMKLLRPENANAYPPLKDEKVVDVKPVRK